MVKICLTVQQTGSIRGLERVHILRGGSACAQLLSLGSETHKERSRHDEKPSTTARAYPPLATTSEKPSQQRRPTQENTYI